ncbi:DUF6497 family protein [Oceaniglobus ichthyenteri]|uniref:DUF6497 family protein n=1 Tax=Oceaniglobus ichthyenteri TaxID=2136177 RepID=UPI0023E8B5EE|nr:DUF6497 family protein [Oceaniglobus ichthyenteri]
MVGPAIAWAETPNAGDVIVVPSAAAVILFDVITDVPGQGVTYRFRFLAEHIGTDTDFAAIGEDMLFLCESYILPRLAAVGPMPDQIVITLLDRPVIFGEMTPEATQFFEAFRPDHDTCIWENL